MSPKKSMMIPIIISIISIISIGLIYYFLIRTKKENFCNIDLIQTNSTEQDKEINNNIEDYIFVQQDLKDIHE